MHWRLHLQVHPRASFGGGVGKLSRKAMLAPVSTRPLGTGLRKPELCSQVPTGSGASGAQHHIWDQDGAVAPRRGQAGGGERVRG